MVLEVNPTEVKRLLRLTKGRENKNFKYAFWLGYELGTTLTLTKAEKESECKAVLSKKGKMTD